MRKRLMFLALAGALIPALAFGQARGRSVYVESNPATDCTGFLSQNEVCNLSIVITGATDLDRTPTQPQEGFIRSIKILSVQNLALDVFVYNRSTFQTANMDADSFLDYWAFVAADGKQVSPTGGTGDQYYYGVTNLEIYYRDHDTVEGATPGISFRGANPPRIHLGIVNRDSTMKLSGAAGAITVKIDFEPLR